MELSKDHFFLKDLFPHFFYRIFTKVSSRSSCEEEGLRSEVWGSAVRALCMSKRVGLGEASMGLETEGKTIARLTFSDPK